MKKLKKLLLSERSAITKMWLDELFASYPADGAKFFTREKNQFANPVGHAFSEGIPGTFDGLVEEDEQKLNFNLDKVIRIRSVHDLNASEAVSYMFFLKDVLRKALRDHLKKGSSVVAELIEFDARIDMAALAAFDVYVKCREQVYELRVNEVKRNVSQILKKTGYFENDQDWRLDQEPGKHLPTP